MENLQDLVLLNFGEIKSFYLKVKSSFCK